MMNGDDATRQGRTAFVQIGIGHNSLRECWGCRGQKSQAGGKYLGRLRLWHCKACVATKEEAKRA